jgi:hypothetical protein
MTIDFGMFSAKFRGIWEKIQKQNDITVKLNSLPLPDIKGTVPRDF